MSRHSTVCRSAALRSTETVPNVPIRASLVPPSLKVLLKHFHQTLRVSVEPERVTLFTHFEPVLQLAVLVEQ